MSSSVANSWRPGSRNFSILKDRMLQSDELPLAEVLDDNQWVDISQAHQIEFDSDEDSIYTPAITLWETDSRYLTDGTNHQTQIHTAPASQSFSHFQDLPKKQENSILQCCCSVTAS